MSNDEYVPSDEEMRRRHSLGVGSDGKKRVFLKYRDEWDRWLAAHDARVRRDAGREALDGVAAHIDSRSSWLAGTEMHSPKARDVLDYRDTHYPEEEDAPDTLRHCDLPSCNPEEDERSYRHAQDLGYELPEEPPMTTTPQAQIDRVRELLTKWVDEYGDPVYMGNGWAEGVRDAAREALKALDGEQ